MGNITAGKIILSVKIISSIKNSIYYSSADNSFF